MLASIVAPDCKANRAHSHCSVTYVVDMHGEFLRLVRCRWILQLAFPQLHPLQAARQATGVDPAQRRDNGVHREEHQVSRASLNSKVIR